MVYCYAMVAKTMWKSRNTLSMRDPPISAKFNKSVTTTNSFSSTNNSFRYKNSARTASMTKGGQKVYPWCISYRWCRWKSQILILKEKKYVIKFLFQMIKMLIVVVACFTICWFPLGVYWVLKYPFPSIGEHYLNPYLFTIFHMLALSHACFNPIICCWMNSSVRYGFMCTFGNIYVY